MRNKLRRANSSKRNNNVSANAAADCCFHFRVFFSTRQTSTTWLSCKFFLSYLVLLLVESRSSTTSFSTWFRPHFICAFRLTIGFVRYSETWQIKALSLRISTQFTRRVVICSLPSCLSFFLSYIFDSRFAFVWRLPIVQHVEHNNFFLFVVISLLAQVAFFSRIFFFFTRWFCDFCAHRFRLDSIQFDFRFDF